METSINNPEKVLHVFVCGPCKLKLFKKETDDLECPQCKQPMIYNSILKTGREVKHGVIEKPKKNKKKDDRGVLIFDNPC